MYGNGLGKYHLATKVWQQKPAYNAYAVNQEIPGKIHVGTGGLHQHWVLQMWQAFVPTRFIPDAWLFTRYLNVQSYMQAD